MTFRVLVTAGYNRSAYARALVTLLTRDEHEVVGAVVAGPVSLARVQRRLREDGVRGIVGDARRLWNRPTRNAGPAPLLAYLDEQKITTPSVSRWCRATDKPCLATRNLNDERTVRFVRDCRPDFVVYGGGGILRRSFLQAAGDGVLNAHAGPLPEIRGMNAVEWSLLLGYPPCVTVHFIDRGIDTGAVIHKKAIPLARTDDVARARDRSVITSIDAIRHVLNEPVIAQPAEPSGPLSRQCFAMAPVIREMLEARLRAAAV